MTNFLYVRIYVDIAIGGITKLYERSATCQPRANQSEILASLFIYCVCDMPE